jgi:hypothetical protein
MTFTHDSASDEFHMWLGYCIANWAKVEDFLFVLFWAALQGPKEQAQLLYYRNNTFGARLGLTDDMVRLALRSYQRGVSDWETLRKEIEALSKTRNRLAHHPVAFRDERVVIDEDSGGFGEVYGVAWAESFVPEGERMTRKKYQKQVLKLGDLRLHRVETEFIKARLGQFLNAMLLGPPLPQPEQSNPHKEAAQPRKPKTPRRERRQRPQ